MKHAISTLEIEIDYLRNRKVEFNDGCSWIKYRDNLIQQLQEAIKILNEAIVKQEKDCRLPSDTACPKAYMSITCSECIHLK